MAAITKTSRVMENLGQRLRRGEWVAEAPLPSVAALSEEYKVSPGTVALALKSLERDGLVKVLPRQGVLATGEAGAGAASDRREAPTFGLYGSYSASEKGYMGVLTHSILSAAHAGGGAVLMLPLLPGGEPLTPEHCRSHGVRGVIFMGGQYRESVERLCNAGFPAITANMPVDATAINYCSYDHREVLEEVASRLVGLGHRRIAFLSCESSTLGLVEICKPHVLARLCDEGCLYDINPYWRNLGINDPGTSRPKIFEAMDAFFSLPEPPTALFCRAATGMVPAVLDWAKERGVKVPEDLSIIAGAYPKGETLTSGFVVQHETLGRCLVESLHQIIRNPFQRIQKTLGFSFVDRGTVAPPRIS